MTSPMNSPQEPQSQETLGKASRRALITAAGAVPVLGAAAWFNSDEAAVLTTGAGREGSLHEVGVPRLSARGGGGSASEPIRTGSARMFALTWKGAAPSGALRLRFRSKGEWGEWTRARQLADAPDRGDPANGRSGTDLIWAPGCDAVQLDVAGGEQPRGLRLVLIDPGTRQEDEEDRRDERDPLGRSSGDGKLSKPRMRKRSAWGAKESLRNGGPSYNRYLKQVHVHHTVNANNYSRSEVPGMIRGMYRYHTQSLGWSDIGYNFLVDRFGRIWVGRAGGPHRKVRGAHTLGFNHSSTGVAVIGNFEEGRPGKRAIGAVARVAAWKLDKYGHKPRGWTRVTSTGSDKYPSGTRVRLKVIDGHRDTNDTSCPGGHLYERLPAIRRRAAKRIEAS